MKLMNVNDDGFPESIVKEGDEVCTRDGEIWIVQPGIGRPPHKPSSTGRIWVKRKDEDWGQEFFPSVFNCKWEEDRGTQS